jgi:alkanesulfonate monooxygenase SsuD/methylene tetrahydromethanopterin reductase-like flavin-dependent oxidoreductase (luciferase family)
MSKPGAGDNAPDRNNEQTKLDDQLAIPRRVAPQQSPLPLLAAGHAPSVAAWAGELAPV